MGKQGSDVPELVFKQLELCFPVTVEHRHMDWWELSTLYLEFLSLNTINKEFPINKVQEKDVEMPEFDYEGRSWYYWWNLLADKYGWSSEHISKLDPDDVLGLFMEIQINEHLDREFQYRLSELAYKYNDKSKTSTYIPLSKPRWMRETTQEVRVPTRRYLKSLMPVGAVIKIDHEEERSKDTELQ